MPDIRTASETPEPERKPGDPGLTDADGGLSGSLARRKGYRQSAGFRCTELLPMRESQPGPGRDTQNDSRRASREAPSRIGALEHGFGYGVTARRHHRRGGTPTPHVYIVTHPREEAYSLFGIPDWMAEDGMCQKRLEGAAATPLEARTPSYGRYYVSAFQFVTVAGETGALISRLDQRRRQVADFLVQGCRAIRALGSTKDRPQERYRHPSQRPSNH